MATVTGNQFNSQIGQQEFLQLLTAQLRNQDPMSPVDQQEFLGQLSQFSMLSGVEQLNTSFGDMLKLQQLTNGASLVGKQVEYTYDDSGATRTGAVEGVQVKDGEVQLKVGDDLVPLGSIIEIQAGA